MNSNINWQLCWSDEFDSDSLDDSTWNRQVEKAGRFNDEWQRYTDDEQNAYIENGKLILRAEHITSSHGMNSYTSARLNTAGKQTFRYGKISARMRLPEGQGIWPAFWLLGANCDENGGDTPWPKCGEIDVFELWGSKDNASVEANVHFPAADGSRLMLDPPKFTLEQGNFSDDFHIFDLIWTEKQMSWAVDGNIYASIDLTLEKFAVFHEEFFILLNIAVGGDIAGRPDNSTSFPQLMAIDWIRYYQMAD